MKYLYLSLFLAVLLISCDKTPKEPKLPAATQIGANTFGYRFNERVWIPESDKKPLNPHTKLLYEFEPYRNSGYFQITATNYNRGGFVRLFSNIAGQPGTYPIGRLDSTHATLIDVGNTCVYYSEDKDTYCQGSITLSRVDYEAGILSGTFAFTIYKPGCDTFKVTDGRFDLKSN